MKIKSYAKVNLILKIGPKTNGLHDIATLISKINLYDVIDIKISNNNKINVVSKGLRIKQEDNLVFKAINLLKSKTGFKQGLKIIIDKKIPLEAGLGGGSSNAANVLLFLNFKLNLGLSKKELINIAVKLGSDVPSFLTNKTVYVTKKGQELKEIKVKLPKYLLLVKPKQGIVTKEAYQIFDQANKRLRKINNIQVLKDIKSKPVFKIMANDFEDSLFKKYKFLNIVHQELSNFGFDKTMLSGSGSSMYSVTNSLVVAKKAYKKLSKKYDFIGIYKFL